MTPDAAGGLLLLTGTALAAVTGWAIRRELARQRGAEPPSFWQSLWQTAAIALAGMISLAAYHRIFPE